MEIFLTIERDQLRTICESLEAKARGFELQANQGVSTDGRKMAMSADSQLKWAAAYHRAASIIRNQIEPEGSE